MLVRYLSILEGRMGSVRFNIHLRLKENDHDGTHVGDSSRIGPVVAKYTMTPEIAITNNLTVQSFAPHTYE